jgi:hypothetical protein
MIFILNILLALFQLQVGEHTSQNKKKELEEYHRLPREQDFTTRLHRKSKNYSATNLCLMFIFSWHPNAVQMSFLIFYGMPRSSNPVDES